MFDLSGMFGKDAPSNPANNKVYGHARKDIAADRKQKQTPKFKTWSTMLAGATNLTSPNGLIPYDAPIFTKEFLEEYEYEDESKVTTFNTDRMIDLFNERM